MEGYAQPTITSFNPISGPIGTTVVISGTNFSTTPSNNFVRFGYASATVITSTATSITVKIPRGATLLPISVMVNQLVTFSSTPFNVTSACNDLSFSFRSFDSTKTFISGTGGGWMAAAGDLDGDGKIDIAYANYYAGANMSVHRNTSTPGIISMDPKIDFAVGLAPDDIVISDFDGDFKPDIIVSTEDNPTYDLAIFRNTSSIGNISFAPRGEFNTGIVTDKLTAADIDNDGKIDLIITYTNTDMLGVLRNISSLENINFAPPVQFAGIAFSGVQRASVGDLDGDGKPDIIVSNIFNSDMTIFRNTSIAGFISFATPLDIPLSGNTIQGTAIYDFDGDGKRDIVACFSNSTFLSVVKNNSTIGNLSFQPANNISIAPYKSYNLSIDDLNGDLKPDLIFSSGYTSPSSPKPGVGIMANISTGGNILFGAMQTFPVDYPAYINLVADMDNDGKPDIVACSGYFSSAGPPQHLAIVRNGICENLFSCQSGTNSITSNILGNVYQWQLDNGSGFTNLINNSNYGGVTTNQLQLLNIPIGFLNYRYRCLVDAVPTGSYLLKFGNTWLGTINNTWENPGNWSCGMIPDIYTDVMIPAGNVQLNNSTSINSITLGSAAILTVSSGANLTIIH